MMLLSQRSNQWNFRYPEGKPFEDRFPKINLVPDNQDGMTVNYTNYSL